MSSEEVEITRNGELKRIFWVDMRALMPMYYSFFLAEEIRLVLYRTTESINRWKSVEGNRSNAKKELAVTAV